MAARSGLLATFVASTTLLLPMADVARAQILGENGLSLQAGAPMSGNVLPLGAAPLRGLGALSGAGALMNAAPLQGSEPLLSESPVAAAALPPVSTKPPAPIVLAALPQNLQTQAPLPLTAGRSTLDDTPQREPQTTSLPPAPPTPVVLANVGDRGGLPPLPPEAKGPPTYTPPPVVTPPPPGRVSPN